MPDGLARAGGVVGKDLGFEQDLEELLVGPAVFAGAVGGLLQPLADPGRFEL